MNELISKLNKEMEITDTYERDMVQLKQTLDEILSIDYEKLPHCVQYDIAYELYVVEKKIGELKNKLQKGK